MTVRFKLVASALCLIAVTVFFAGEAHANPWVKDTVQALHSIATGKTGCRAMTASYANGNGYRGWTFVSVEKSIVKVRITHPNKQDRTYTGRLENTECHDLAQASVDGKLWSVRRTRMAGQPDETLPRITLGVGGVGSFMVSQWMNDAPKTPAFAKTQRLLQRLLRRVVAHARERARKATKTAAR